MEPSNFPNQSFLGITGFIRTLSEEPNSAGVPLGTLVPRNLSEQVVLVRTGGSTALWIYDMRNTTWKYTTLT